MEISNKELNITLKESGLRDKYRAENIKNWAKHMELKDQFYRCQQKRYLKPK